MTAVKLNYIHGNPCSTRWKLAENPSDYIHSSAKYYLTGEQGIYAVTNYMELEDIDLTSYRQARNKPQSPPLYINKQ